MIARYATRTKLVNYRQKTRQESAPSVQAPAGICLVMIVKNEARVITRCLGSVKPIIDHWIVVDTGSTDGTQDVIREHMKDIPGELFERPWKGFAASRNDAIELAVGKCSHVLVIDADDLLIVHEKPVPTGDAHQVRVLHGPLEHYRPHVFRPELPQYRYHDVVHEYLGGTLGPVLEGIAIQIVGGGSRSSDPDKFLRDATLIESELKKDPTHPRYMFYLAQSWKDYGDDDKALLAYRKRVAMGGGFADEIFCSLLEIARILERQKEPGVIEAYLRAWEYQPHRVESLFSLGLHLRSQGRWPFAAMIFDVARKALKPGGLFVEAYIYDWQALYQFAIAADYVPGRRAQAVDACTRLLTCAPESEKATVRKNLACSKEKLKREGR